MGALVWMPFVGIGGPYRVDSNQDGAVDELDTPNANALGLSLSGVEFGVALLASEEESLSLNDLQWLALQANADTVELVGIPEVTAEFRDLDVVINQVSGVAEGVDPDDYVIDFAAVPLDVITGTETSLTLNVDGQLGELIRASGDVKLAISEFFYVEGLDWF